MSILIIKHHVFGFKKGAVGKVVAVAVFALVFNLINLGAFYKGSAIEFNAAAVAASGVGKVMGNVNLPMKIMEDLFKGEKGLAGKNASEENNAPLAAITASSYKSGELLSKRFISPAAEAHKRTSYFTDTSQGGLPVFPPGSDFVRYLLLFLLLMSALPRGVPVNIKKHFNIVFSFPCFRNEAGFFYAQSVKAQLSSSAAQQLGNGNDTAVSSPLRGEGARSAGEGDEKGCHSRNLLSGICRPEWIAAMTKERTFVNCRYLIEAFGYDSVSVISNMKFFKLQICSKGE